MRTRAAGFAEGSEFQASSSRDRTGGSVILRIFGAFAVEAGGRLRH
jgi:hypothetical protein